MVYFFFYPQESWLQNLPSLQLPLPQTYWVRNTRSRTPSICAYEAATQVIQLLSLHFNHCLRASRTLCTCNFCFLQTSLPAIPPSAPSLCLWRFSYQEENAAEASGEVSRWSRKTLGRDGENFNCLNTNSWNNCRANLENDWLSKLLFLRNVSLSFSWWGWRRGEGRGGTNSLGISSRPLNPWLFLPWATQAFPTTSGHSCLCPQGPDLPFEAWKGREGLLQDTEILVWSCCYSGFSRLCYIKIGMEFRSTLACEMMSNFV